MRVIFLALSGLAAIVSAEGEETEVQCIGPNKLHCCKEVLNKTPTAKETCESYNCSSDIQCNSVDDSSQEISSKTERALYGGWNSKVSKLFSQ
jgi:hypothetical protein